MSEHRYILEPYKGIKNRYSCPACQQNKTFSLYIDIETGKHINSSVGRCNRENNCGYHYTPKQYFQDNNTSFNKPQPIAYRQKPVIPQPKPVSYIPVEIFKASLNPSAFETNHFIKFLIDLFGVEVASEMVSRYFVATSKYWNGATVFWQIDTQGKVRTGKIMQYNPTTGKRVKNLMPPVYWVHKALKQPEFELKQCLFGEHLLIDKTKPVAIVESEKTAIIANVYLPQFTWLAVGSLTNLNAEKCSILKGRTITLFPDLNGFDKWSIKAKELSHLARFTVSDLLERKATEAEKKQGLDLADFLIKLNYKDFELTEPVYYLSKPKQPEQEQRFSNSHNTHENFTNNVTQCNTIKKETRHNATGWNISELEKYYNTINLNRKPFTFKAGHEIINLKSFVNSHFEVIKANTGNETFKPFLMRLQQVKKYIELNQN